MGVAQPAVGADHEVTAKLEQVVAASRFPRKPAPNDSSQIPAQDPEGKDCAPTRPAQAETAICFKQGVGDRGEGQGIPFEKCSNLVWPAKANDKDLAAESADLVVTFLHLAEVCAAC